ncbi:MAG: DNA translocase FtsK [Bacteroidales bacterium]|jgi:S-DNA-T family DNA segregation ATPase FtsK/SpoIIIE|nr:DNA translocase FtsK [Bacteroidales bacterium]
MAKRTKKTEQTDDTTAENVSLQTLKSEKFRLVSGVFFVAFALFMLFGFVSYLFSWWIDFDQVSHISTYDLFADSSAKIRNVSGRMGAYIAHGFIRNGFGLSSFLFILIALGIGLKLLKIQIFKLRKLILHSAFFIVWGSVTFGFITLGLGKWSILGGIFGFEIAHYLKAAIGVPGLIILLGGVLMMFLSIAYSMNFNVFPTMKNWFETFKKDTKSDVNELLNEDDKNEKLISDDEDTFSLLEQIENVGAENFPPLQTDDEVPFIIENTDHSEDDMDDVHTPNETDVDEEPLIGHGIDTLYNPYEDLSNYKFPTLDLLEDYGMKNVDNSKQSDELIANKKLIENTLKSFGVEIAQIKATIGPTVTLYEIVPAAGVRISKIQNLENDIALSLSALGIRIIAPIPGKGTIGIEVPNLTKQIVPMKVMLDSSNFKDTKFDLPIALGKTIQNECYVADLAKMPHLLMAGATGQGKSVGLNAIIASLLYKKHPADLKFVLVDPKKVELTLYNKIERHYLAKLSNVEDAIITDTKKVVNTLNSLCVEMDMRYNLLKDAQVKGIKEYNAKFISRRLNPNDGHRYLPYIVLVVDEFADLIMTAGKEVELPIARLAQLARAIGIHLIIATQRPSVNIITGTIKANFPARIAFRVTSKIDSRTILDSGGADQLIGKGDMLLSTGNELIRIQCALIDTPEIERIAEFIGEQRGYPEAYELPECADESSGLGGGTFSADERDSMFDDAARLIVSSQSGSTSLIQRKLKLGYARSGRLMDQLEDAGIVGPSQGSKPREVYIKDMQTLENLLMEN